ncbi:MAG: EamA family transporter [Gammaproteobacteria bacterium]
MHLNWFWNAFIGMLCFAGMALTFKKLTFVLQTPLILFYVFVLNSILYLLYSGYKGVIFHLDWKSAAWILLATFLAFVGNLCDVEALRSAPNAGYASAVKSGQIVMITVAALFLFEGQSLSLQGLAGIVLILAGLILLSTQK